MIPRSWAISAVTTGATTEEMVSLADAKSVTRLDSTSTGDDAYLSMLIPAGRVYMEIGGNIATLRRQYDMVMDAVPGGDALKIPKTPLVSVDQVVGINSTGGETALSTDAYAVDVVSKPGRLLLNPGYSWPTGLREYAGFRVRFTAGHSTAAAGIPDPLRLANLQYIAHFYEHRGDGDAPLPPSVEELLGDFYMPEAS